MRNNPSDFTLCKYLCRMGSRRTLILCHTVKSLVTEHPNENLTMNPVNGKTSNLSPVQLNASVDSKQLAGLLGPWQALVISREVKYFIQGLS